MILIPRTFGGLWSEPAFLVPTLGVSPPYPDRDFRCSARLKSAPQNNARTEDCVAGDLAEERMFRGELFSSVQGEEPLRGVGMPLPVVCHPQEASSVISKIPHKTCLLNLSRP